MREPNKEVDQTEFDLWREYREMKRFRKNLLDMEDSSWYWYELKRNENF